MGRAVAVAGIIAVILMSVGAVANAGEKPSVSVDWYGYFKLDGSYDQNLSSHGNFIMWVNPSEDDAQFNMTVKQTRLGLNATGSGYGNATVKGKLEMDLYGNGAAENKAALVIRHAYFSIQSGNTKLLAGQSWDLISPLNPSTLNYTVLWGCGNFQYRRPQVSLHQTFAMGENTKATLSGGFFRTIGTDLIPLSFSLAGETSDGSDDGTDAAIPSMQGRLDINYKFSSGAKLRIGGSGLYGQLKAETNLGNSETYKSWTGCGHLMFSLPSGAGFAGEVYSGSNLAAYLGGIANGNTVEGVGALGAWASAWVKPAPKVKLSSGFGIDQVEEDDIGDGARMNNQCFFGNASYSIVPGASVGFEVSQWQTEYKNVDTYSSLRAQTSFVLKF
ncbi:MAG: hypothetical protein GY839_07860 [candidate division Zixibacteria bacterium]|nr:hypothetical protein [candidate division Zixibacteria bacterium]